jgi:transposase
VICTLANRRCDVGHRNRGSNDSDYHARGQQRAGVLFHAARSGASQHRSDGVGEMVFAADGRTENRLSGGHPATIRVSEPRRQKHDQRDAELLPNLLVENRFPSIWQPSKEQLDLRGLLLHRHQCVRLRTRLQNALQAIALVNGLRRGSSLWSASGQRAVASQPLATHTAQRHSELQAMYARFEAEIEQLNQRVLERAGQRPTAGLLMTHPGVGPVTAVATDVLLGDPKRFRDSKPLASYIGIISREHSSGWRQ